MSKLITKFKTNPLHLLCCGWFLGMLLMGGEVMGQTSGDYRSKATGNWNAAATWETWNGSAWVESGTPSSANGVITIRDGHTVTITAAVTIDQVMVEEGGGVIHSASATVTLNNGSGTDLQIFGTWRRTTSSFTISISSGATMSVESGGVYEHAIGGSGGSIPTASWNANSILRIMNSATMTSAPTGLDQTFGIVEINIPDQTSNWAIDGFTNVTNEFRVISTGSGYIRLNSTKSFTGSFVQSGGRFINSLVNSSTTFTIGGNLTISGGTFEVSNNSNISYADAVVINGNIIVNGGTINLQGSNNANAGRLFVKGNLTVSSGTLARTQTSTDGSTGIYFEGTGDQTFTWSGGTINSQVLKRFYYKTSSGPTGLNEIYSASVAQSTVNGSEGSPASGYAAWPTSGALVKNVTINNSEGVTLSTNKTVNETLTLTNGVYTLSNTLTMANGASIVRSGGSLSAAPTFVTSVNVTYAQHSSSITTGVELPSSSSVLNNLTINTTNGVTLNNARTVNGTLTLINGILTNTSTNTLTIANNATGAVSGGSTTSFVSGPLRRTLPASASSSGTYLFPVGKTSTYYPFTLSNLSSGGTSPVVSVEAFDANSGGTAGDVNALSTTEYWSASIVSGNYTDGRVSIGRQTALGDLNVIARSATQGGTYSSLVGAVDGTNIINSNLTGNSLGFFLMADGGSCLPFDAGSIETTGEAICTNPAEISSNALAVGGDGAVQYRWQYSIDALFTSPIDIADSDNESYTPPPGLTENRWYRRQAKDGGTCDVSDWVTSTGAWAVTLQSAPSTQASGLSFSIVGATGMTINWSGSGNGDGVIVVMKAGSAPTNPTNDTEYSASTTFGSGTNINSDGSFVLFNGSGSSVAVTGLSASTTYHVSVYSRNCSGAAIKINTTAPLSGSQITLAPELAAHPATFSAIGSAGQVELTFSAASTITNAFGYIILQRTGGNPTGTPNDATSYNVGNAIGDGTVAAIITDLSQTTITISGLEPSTAYHYSIIAFSYDGTNSGTYNYYIAATIKTANATTPAAANRYSIASGNWNQVGTWSNTSGGSSCSCTPASGDVIFIANHTITVTESTTASSIRFTGTSGTLSVNSGIILTVTGSITLNHPTTANHALAILTGSGTISAASISVGETTSPTLSAGSSQNTQIRSTLTALNISGNINLRAGSGTSSRYRSPIFDLNSGTLTLGGTISPTGIAFGDVNIFFRMTQGDANGTLILNNSTPWATHSNLLRPWGNQTGAGYSEYNVSLNGTNATVVYNASGAQTILRTGNTTAVNVSHTNLTLAGSGIKTLPTTASTTVSGTLSIQGTATLTTTGTLSYGANSTLEYKGSAAQTTAAGEFLTGASAPLNLIIDNPDGVTLHASRTLRTSGANNLTLTNGTLNNSTHNLTLSNASNIIRSGGSLSAAPTFGASVHVTYTQYGSTIVSGFELPSATTVLNNLTINTTNGVTLNDSRRVNGTLFLSNGRLNTGACNSATTSATLLTLSDNATVSGASTSSYVNGVMRKIGDDAFTFPVGDALEFAPIGISAPIANTDEFGACYTRSSAIDISSNIGVDIVNISDCEHWFLNRHNGNSSALVTLSWDMRSCGVTDPSELLVVRYNGTNWESLGNSETTGNNSSGTITSNTVNSFSPFTLGSSTANNPLPVELTDFNAHCSGNSVELSWTTASEYNASHYNLEKSIDGYFWNIIAQIDASGTTNQTSHYTYLDRQNSNLSYYRLIQFDFDGASDSLKTISSACEWENHRVSVLPNPNNGEFTISGLEEGVIIQIINIMGQVVYEETASSNFSVIQLGKTHKGIYFLRSQTDQIQTVTKFIIK